MSKLKKADFYYGAVLSTLLNNGICPMLIEGGEDRQIYDFTTNHKDFRLFVKYTSLPIDTKTKDYASWQFVFSKDDVKEIQEYLESEKEFSVGLVCGNNPLQQSHYAVIPKSSIQEILNQKKTSITISLRKGEKAFRISIGGGRENAIKIKTKNLF